MDRNQLLFGVLFFAGAGALVAGCSLPTGEPKINDMAMGGGSDGPVGPVADLSMPPTGSLPFIVDTVFVSSGFMGDGSQPGAITMVPAKMGDSTDCMGKRGATTAAGSCHVAAYTPPASGSMGWGGVYWQYPANNWGTKPGFVVPSGAKQVSFSAKGDKGGEKVTFLAGGIIDPANPYSDSVKATASLTLTAEWAPYTIDLSGQSYTQVLGGFGWTMTAADVGAGGGFLVDDIQWR